MKLILWSPSENESPKTSAYLTAKCFQGELETADVFTGPALQAALLISLYEIGHAIYPSAYLSVGLCARFANALGIDRSKTCRRDEQVGWVEVEERNRIWWAVLMIDRYARLCYS